MASPYIKTRSGLKFFYDEPTPEMVSIDDIAHALSNLCRFNGHTRTFFSVAQHSVEVANLLYASAAKEHRALSALCGLLHDAHEAYVGDFPTPFKVLLGQPFREAESFTIEAIETRLNITDLMRRYEDAVHWADRQMLWSDAIRWGMDGVLLVEGEEIEVAREWVSDTFVPHFRTAQPLAPGLAKEAFLNLYNGLCRDIRDDRNPDLRLTA
jgi:5'-deoxynucleotidase YfbR-like HD superfamily hydrolase